MTKGFARGSFVETPSGAVRVEHLRTGERVLTRTGHAAPIRWIGLESRDPTAPWPVTLRLAAKDYAGPLQSLTVGATQRILKQSPLGFGNTLVHACNVRDHKGAAPVDLFQILLRDSALILVNGLWLETLDDIMEGSLTPSQPRALGRMSLH